MLAAPPPPPPHDWVHYNGVILSAMASQITSLTVVFTQPYIQAQVKENTKVRTGNSPVTVEFPAQRASNAENISIWWRNRVLPHLLAMLEQPTSWHLQCFGLLHVIYFSSQDDVINWKHLCGEFTGHRWIPLTKASDTELWCFVWSAPEFCWVNNGEAGDLRRHHDVTATWSQTAMCTTTIYNIQHWCLCISYRLFGILQVCQTSIIQSYIYHFSYATSFLGIHREILFILHDINLLLQNSQWSGLFLHPCCYETRWRWRWTMTNYIS